MENKAIITCQAWHGKGIISKGIRFQTRSPYSHISAGISREMVLIYLDWLAENNFPIPPQIQARDADMVIEAWHTGGVQYRPFGVGHASGTRVDVYTIQQPVNYCVMMHFLMKQVGKKYDFRNIFRFIARTEPAYNDKWFCSELFERAVEESIEEYRGVSRPLQNGAPASHSPRDTVMSSILPPMPIAVRYS